MAKQSIMAALNMQPLPAAHKWLSDWSVPETKPAQRIQNSKEAFQFMISEEITEQAFCAVLLDRDNYVINRRYFLEDFENVDLIVEVAAKYKARSLYFFHLEDKEEDFYIVNTKLIGFAIPMQNRLAAKGVFVADVMSICQNNHFSWRQRRWLQWQKHK